MRRLLPFLVCCALLVVPAFPQRGGGGARGGGGGGMRGGGGGGGMRGGGGGGMRGGGGAGFRGGSFNGFRGGFRGGFNRGRFGFGFSNFGYSPGFYGYGGFYDPFWWDFWDNGDYGYSGYPSNPYPYQNPYGGYGYGTSGGPSVMIISNNPYGYAPPPPPAQPEVIEVPPNTAEAPARSTQPAKYEDPLFLLALHDGTIRAVLAYWLDGQTVHYVTMEHEQRQTPLSSIDRDLSERLNRERNVTFRLPGGSLQ